MQKCTPLPKAMWRLGLRLTSKPSGWSKWSAHGRRAQELDDDLVLPEVAATQLRRLGDPAEGALDGAVETQAFLDRTVSARR